MFRACQFSEVLFVFNIHLRRLFWPDIHIWQINLVFACYRGYFEFLSARLHRASPEPSLGDSQNTFLSINRASYRNPVRMIACVSRLLYLFNGCHAWLVFENAHQIFIARLSDLILRKLLLRWVGMRLEIFWIFVLNSCDLNCFPAADSLIIYGPVLWAFLIIVCVIVRIDRLVSINWAKNIRPWTFQHLKRVLITEVVGVVNLNGLIY